MTGPKVDWCGRLIWDLAETEFRAFVAQRQPREFDIRLANQEEAAALELALLDQKEFAVHSPAEGALKQIDATQEFLVKAQSRGAAMVIGQPVERLKLDDDAGRV